MVSVTIGRLGEAFKLVENLNDNTTVKEAFENNGFTISDNENCRDLDKNEIDFDEEIDNGVTYVLVASVKSGF